MKQFLNRFDARFGYNLRNVNRHDTSIPIPRKLSPVLGIAVPALVAALALAGCNGSAPAGSERVVIAGRNFTLELATNSDQIAQGLMGRTALAEDAGMLFIFPTAAQRGFWMKNCLIPIDVIFLDAAGRIVAMHTMQPPNPKTPDDELPLYSSYYPAQFAIELAGGSAQRMGLANGQKIDLALERLKALAR